MTCTAQDQDGATDGIKGRLSRYQKPAPVLIVITGPSGVGKDAVISCIKESGYPFHFVVTATDRRPRPDEREGIDYYFYSTNEFERMIATDELFEYARVYGQYKGVPKAQIREALVSGRDVIMRVDVQGAETIRSMVPQAITVFLAPPSIAILRQRLERRDSDSNLQIEKRLTTALKEMGRLRDFDYVVINREGQLEAAASQIVAIATAEKCRADHRAVEV